MIKRLALTALAVAALSQQALASGYGTAGCGLGSVILGDSKGIAQVFAATTNGTSGSQTFGITSGTSNCGGGGAAPTLTAFIEANREALSNDIARGNGETLTNFTQLMGCKSSQGVGALLQKNFKQIFPNEKVSASQIENSIKSTIQASKTSVCS